MNWGAARKDKYRFLSSSVLRGMLRATSARPLCDVFRSQRLAIDDELNARAIAEAIEEMPESWRSLPVEGVQ